MGVIYLERFAKMNPLIPFDKCNMHRFLMVAVVVAIKFIDDAFFSNEYYRKIAGLSLEEFNGLE